MVSFGIRVEKISVRNRERRITRILNNTGVENAEIVKIIFVNTSVEVVVNFSVLHTPVIFIVVEVVGVS